MAFISTYTRNKTERMDHNTIHRPNHQLSTYTYPKTKLQITTLTQQLWPKQEHCQRHKNLDNIQYYSQLVRKITKLFKHTDVGISFKSTNTIQHPTTPKTTNNIHEHNKCVIYKPTCNTCKLSHVGQTSQPQTRYQEHIRYIKQKDHQPAYFLHIVKNNHEYGPINSTITLLKQITKTSLLIPYEHFYTQSHYYHNELILGQNTGGNNLMYQLIFDLHITSLPAVHTIQYYDTLPLPRPKYRTYSSYLLECLHKRYVLYSNHFILWDTVLHFFLKMQYRVSYLTS
jgi:hypothetical protein